MPYKQGTRLPAEKASKLGHLQVIESPLVKDLIKEFNDLDFDKAIPESNWTTLPDSGKELKIIFSSDGSLQPIEWKSPPYKAIAFVKTALLKLDFYELSKIDKDTPNPFALKDLMEKSALFHATAFPLRNVNIEGKTIYNAIREIIYESICDKGKDNALNREMIETLKWIVYEKWNTTPKAQLEKFGCPHCLHSTKKDHATLPYDEETGKCPNCNGDIFITDLFGLHYSMTEDHAKNEVATNYMSIAETLMIFTPIRYYWENNRGILNECLFVKDGPLSLRATLSKLAAPLRNFFKYAKEQGVEIAMIGQEKSGQFFDHLQLIGNHAPNNSIFIPDNDYIREEIQYIVTDSIYGQDTNYGAKVLIKLNEYHKMVINIPTGEKGEFVTSPDINNLIRINDIIATLPKIISNRFEGALLPIELANGVASLSTYPSAKTLELFAEKAISEDV